ncbi:MAG: hypothetical protein KF693_02800 [Nitrospira sp.]|nr:hypothetical protein [Nitrospira sp.]
MTERLTNRREFLEEVGLVVYHVAVITLSAGVASALPNAANFVAQSAIENNKVAVIAVEVAVAILLIAGINGLCRTMKNQRLAEMATYAGLKYVFPANGTLTRTQMDQVLTRQARAKNLMIIGSTGYHTFVKPEGHLHTRIWKSLESKIMLLNPYSEGARIRASALLDSAVTPEALGEEIEQSIELCKRLKAGQKSVRLKLYSDPPHVKLAILGDFIWLQHYHTGLDVHTMPEYVFEQNQNDYGLYTLFYQYFTRRWESPEIPEYDLDTDELVYRESNGTELRREQFPKRSGNSPQDLCPAIPLTDGALQDR